MKVPEYTCTANNNLIIKWYYHNRLIQHSSSTSLCTFIILPIELI